MLSVGLNRKSRAEQKENRRQTVDDCLANANVSRSILFLFSSRMSATPIDDGHHAVASRLLILLSTTWNGQVPSTFLPIISLAGL